MVDGLNFAAQYQGKNDRSDFDNYTEGNGDGFLVSLLPMNTKDSVSVQLMRNLIVPTLKLMQGKFSPEVFASGKNAEVWAAGLKYDANNIYLATTYSETQRSLYLLITSLLIKLKTSKLLHNISSISVCVRPLLTCNLKVRILEYGRSGLVKYVDVGATYYFNKNMSTFVDYKINLLDKNDFTKALGVSTDDIVAVGLVYQFGI